ncbi:MAG: hypothetical protein SPK70_09165, partial [Succinivibrio dextrinosolvens]|nr:hypothetical protein [Succinivibrio dextrinosolvens]
ERDTSEGRYLHLCIVPGLMLLHNRPEFLSTIPAYVGFVLTECLCVFFNPEGIKQIIILFGVIHLFYLLSFLEKKWKKRNTC